MNMYDTKTIHCSGCGKFIGEIDYDAIVTLPKCGKCSNHPVREGQDCICLCTEQQLVREMKADKIALRKESFSK